jgi:protein TonB
VEAGGLLLGHRVARNTIEIDDYLWVSSEEQPGSRYSLDTSALERLRAEYSARDEKARRSQVVGYFRTQADDNLHLRDEEISLVREHFRDPTDVVLLIRTSDKSYTSGFLFWTTADDFAPFPLMEFPLDAGRLQTDAGWIGNLTNEPSEEEVEETTQRLPAIPDKPAVPLAESASTSGAKPISRPAEDVSFNLRLRSHPEWPQKRQSIPNAGGQINQAEPADIPAPETVAAARREPARVSLRVVVAVAAVFAFLALAGLSAFLLRDRWSPAPKQKAPATVAAFPLQLDVEAQGDGLNVRWNPLSAPVTQAREGRLTILEGDQQPPRIIPLDLQQLTSGHIYYRSAAERVQFQLEIVGNSGGISRESVLALSSTPAPPVSRAAPPQPGTAPSPVRKVETIPIPSTDTGAPPFANTTQTPPSRQSVARTFTAPPSRDRVGQPPAIAFDQAPAISTNAALPPAAVLPTTLSNLPANNPPAPQAKEPPATKQIRVGSLQAANLIKRVTPVYPPVAMSQHIQGIVRFTATIGKDGTVQNLQLISGNRALVQAATDAVKQWLYRPTLLNGEPVEIVTQIDVNFTLNQ